MVKLLLRFNLTCPCSAPLLVVAHSRAHTRMLLHGISRMGCRAGEWMLGPQPEISEAHASVCQPLYQELYGASSLMLRIAVSSLAYGAMQPSPMYRDMQQGINEKAEAATPHLRAGFQDFYLFQHLARYGME